METGICGSQKKKYLNDISRRFFVGTVYISQFLGHEKKKFLVAVGSKQKIIIQKKIFIILETDKKNENFKFIEKNTATEKL